MSAIADTISSGVQIGNLLAMLAQAAQAGGCSFAEILNSSQVGAAASETQANASVESGETKKNEKAEPEEDAVEQGGKDKKGQAFGFTVFPLLMAPANEDVIRENSGEGAAGKLVASGKNRALRWEAASLPETFARKACEISGEGDQSGNLAIEEVATSPSQAFRDSVEQFIQQSKPGTLRSDESAPKVNAEPIHAGKLDDLAIDQQRNAGTVRHDVVPAAAEELQDGVSTAVIEGKVLGADPASRNKEGSREMGQVRQQGETSAPEKKAGEEVEGRVAAESKLLPPRESRDEPKEAVITVSPHGPTLMNESTTGEKHSVESEARVHESSSVDPGPAVQSRVAYHVERVAERLSGPELHFDWKAAESETVHVSTMLRDQTLELGIAAEHPETAAVLRTDLSELSSQLREHSIRLGEVTITAFDSATMQMDSGSRHRSGQEWRSQPLPETALFAGTSDVAEEVELWKLKGEGGSVSLLA